MYGGSNPIPQQPHIPLRIFIEDHGPEGVHVEVHPGTHATSGSIVACVTDAYLDIIKRELKIHAERGRCPCDIENFCLDVQGALTKILKKYEGRKK